MLTVPGFEALKRKRGVVFTGDRLKQSDVGKRVVLVASEKSFGRESVGKTGEIVKYEPDGFEMHPNLFWKPDGSTQYMPYGGWRVGEGDYLMYERRQPGVIVDTNNEE